MDPRDSVTIYKKQLKVLRQKLAPLVGGVTVQVFQDREPGEDWTDSLYISYSLARFKGDVYAADLAISEAVEIAMPDVPWELSGGGGGFGCRDLSFTLPVSKYFTSLHEERR